MKTKRVGLSLRRPFVEERSTRGSPPYYLITSTSVNVKLQRRGRSPSASFDPIRRFFRVACALTVRFFGTKYPPPLDHLQKRPDSVYYVLIQPPEFRFLFARINQRRA